MPISEKWGTGRKDWSSNIEISVVPITRSHQYRSFGTGDWDLTPYDYLTIDAENTYGTIGSNFFSADTCKYYYNKKMNFIVHRVSVTLSANVLIKAYFSIHNWKTGEVIRYQEAFGYGEVTFLFPKGFFVSYTTLGELWTPLIEFLPGGYLTRTFFLGMTDVYAPK